MTGFVRACLAAMLVCGVLIGCATVAPSTPSTSAAFASARTDAQLFGDIIVAAQPSATDLSDWHAEGVDTVFNVRTAAEMADRGRVPFDEAALAEDLGLSYVQSPIGGNDHPYAPHVLDAFAAAVARAKGPVLLHCGTGARAGQVYAAYAVKYLGRSPDEVMRELEPLGLWPLPLEQLTGQPLRLIAD